MNKIVYTYFFLFLLYVSAIKGFAQSNSIMNEVFSRGTTAEPDWIEIYNLSNSAIDISGYKIYDIGGQSGTKPKKVFATGTSIPANGYLVIVTDDTSASGFGLSSNGETVWIENVSGSIVDSVVFPALQTNESYSRVPNGGNWIVTNSITKGTANIYSNPTTVVINEIYSRGTTLNPDWIELYNPSSIQIDISGYKIYDGGGYAGTKPKKIIPSGSIIPPTGFLVVVTDDTTLSGFGLSSNGEEVWLENAIGLVLDDVNFPAMDTTQSYCRFPDGTSSWVISNYITKGFLNLLTDVDYTNAVLTGYSLFQNHPNPFNPSTTISYSITSESYVNILVYNVLGQVVKELINSYQQSGHHSIMFNASELSSGVYLYKMNAVSIDGTRTIEAVRKMILIK